MKEWPQQLRFDMQPRNVTYKPSTTLALEITIISLNLSPASNTAREIQLHINTPTLKYLSVSELGNAPLG